MTIEIYLLLIGAGITIIVTCVNDYLIKPFFEERARIAKVRRQREELLNDITTKLAFISDFNGFTDNPIAKPTHGKTISKQLEQLGVSIVALQSLISRSGVSNAGFTGQLYGLLAVLDGAVARTLENLYGRKYDEFENRNQRVLHTHLNTLTKFQEKLRISNDRDFKRYSRSYTKTRHVSNTGDVFIVLGNLSLARFVRYIFC